MIRYVGKIPDRLNRYDRPQKVVLSVITPGQTVYIATSLIMLRQSVAGSNQGVQLTSTSGNVALDLAGEIYWSASADGVQVDVMEAGAL